LEIRGILLLGAATHFYHPKCEKMAGERDADVLSRAAARAIPAGVNSV
jgi:hypothetical protein